MSMRGMRWVFVIVCALSAVASAGRAEVIGCEQAGTHLVLTASAELDPSCTWTGGLEIVASNVVLDCRGAHVVGTGGGVGIQVHAATDMALANVVVRNCVAEGFLNNVRITRDGFHDLAAGVEYEHALSNILVEDSTSLNSRGVGVYVDGFVTGVTLRNLHVQGAGSAGIYLEEGSRDNVVEGSEIVNNGYRENGPGGQLFQFSGITFWFWGIGREGIAIDGSRNNVVRNDSFSGNSADAIFL
jgi:parallel beta helix pectate lyase-like protein